MKILDRITKWIVYIVIATLWFYLLKAELGAAPIAQYILLIIGMFGVGYQFILKED